MTAGLSLFVIGGVLWLLGHMGVSAGKLPGDIHIKGEKGDFYFPLTTCVLISLFLTFMANVISWLFKK